MVPKLAVILSQKGELLDADFNTYNIKVDESIKSKDNLVLSRKRMVLLTNTTLVQKEEEKRKKKLKDHIENQEKKRLRKEKAGAARAAKVARTGKMNTIAARNSIETDEDSDIE